MPAKKTKTEGVTKKSKPVDSKSAGKKTEKKAKKVETPVKIEKTKKVKEVEQAPRVLTKEKLKFIDIITEMFYDSRTISHLLFNGLFRLPSNRRLYEFSDEEVVKAFSQQLKIMETKKEKEASEGVKKAFLKRVIE